MHHVHAFFYAQFKSHHIDMKLTSHPQYFPPLFDRLNAESACLLTEDEYIESIQMDILRILSSRSFLRYDDMHHTPFEHLQNFGIPDVPHFDPANKTLWPSWAQALSRTLQNLETRLDHIHVTVTDFDISAQKIKLRIAGTLRHIPTHHFHFHAQII